MIKPHTKREQHDFTTTSDPTEQDSFFPAMAGLNAALTADGLPPTAAALIEHAGKNEAGSWDRFTSPITPSDYCFPPDSALARGQLEVAVYYLKAVTELSEIYRATKH